MRDLAKQSGLHRDDVNRAAERYLWSQYAGGRLLLDMRMAGTRHDGKSHKKTKSQPEIPKLADLEIEKTAAHRWQKLASIPEREFEAFIRRTIDAGEELTTAAALGLVRQAILFATGANAAHGLRRTNKDKRQAVLALLNDEEWCLWSDNRIAEQAAVSHPFVMQVRRELVTVTSSPASKSGDAPRIGKDGKARKQRKRKPAPQREPGEDEPEPQHVDGSSRRVAPLPRRIAVRCSGRTMLLACVRIDSGASLSRPEASIRFRSPWRCNRLCEAA